MTEKSAADRLAEAVEIYLITNSSFPLQAALAAYRAAQAQPEGERLPPGVNELLQRLWAHLQDCGVALETWESIKSAALREWAGKKG